MRNKETSRLIVDMKRHNIDVFDEFGRYNYVNTKLYFLPISIRYDRNLLFSEGKSRILRR